MKDYQDIWWKPHTWNPVSRPFAWGFLFLATLLVIAAISGAPYR